ncbi:MAG: DNA primase [Bacteroidota bacterium]
MISRDTIDRILEAARIEEVVGDHVSLKKRGSNLLGLCPFHNEKTPSFNVNPARNIFKCFGCGEGGNPVDFLMKLEHLSFPEALRSLADRYGIEIEETRPDPEQQQQLDEKEAMFILNGYAQQTFSSWLTESDEGRSVGLGYFNDRGFTDEIVRKFQLGYSQRGWSTFSEKAVADGYNESYLEKTGLAFRNDKGKLTDRFRERVMFPIHNVSGRVIGFGGRILRKDDKTAKYLNSPESEVYHKSKALYGIFQGKKSIVQKDECFLVEGYTDVISLHQAGIENVVAPCGTSLTVEQVRMIARYTKNLTLLFDGDNAGIKGAIRGIDMILEEGLNVRVVLFPDGEDPDSFARKNEPAETVAFIRAAAVDFIEFKTGLLLREAGNDPVKKAALIREVVTSISKIPDIILRSTYVKRCSELLAISEPVLLNELNRSRRQTIKKEQPEQDVAELLPETLRPEQPVESLTTEEQEKNIIRLLLNYGHHKLMFVENSTDENGHPVDIVHEPYVARFIVDEILGDSIRFDHPAYDRILRSYSDLPDTTPFLEPEHFLRSEEKLLREVAVELLSPRYQLSENWYAMHGIHVPSEEHELLKAVEQSVYHLKQKKVLRMLEENRQRIKEAQTDGSDITALLEEHLRLERIKTDISRILGIDILR